MWSWRVIVMQSWQLIRIYLEWHPKGFPHWLQQSHPLQTSRIQYEVSPGQCVHRTTVLGVGRIIRPVSPDMAPTGTFAILHSWTKSSLHHHLNAFILLFSVLFILYLSSLLFMYVYTLAHKCMFITTSSPC